MTTTTQSDRYAPGEALYGPLAAQLPGLADALDDVLTARQIEQRLLRPGGRVHHVAPGALWYGADGSCSLRYRVAVSFGTTDATEHSVLARVYPTGSVDAGWLANEERGLAPSTDPPYPWRRWTSAHPAPGVSLDVFPADPANPNLAQAMNLGNLQGEDWPDRDSFPTSVELVHHPRRGASVLRYGVGPANSSSAARRAVYGKVYPDPTSGLRAQRFLQSWAGPGRVRIPPYLGYTPRLSLLLTAALPGEPLLPRLLRSATGVAAHSAATRTHDMVLSTGRALAAFHQVREAAAPVETLRHLTQILESELAVVQRVWPEMANRARSLWNHHRLDSEADGPPVLCHGDFTPSQILFVDDSVSGIVDVDTACWGEPAMDLGRFMAHLDLFVAKQSSRNGELLGARLRDRLLSGYAEATGTGVIGQPLLSRIAHFRSASLILTALHACRQLKEHRMNRALSLLDIAVNPKERGTS